MAAWNGLREGVRTEGEAVAPSPAFRETFDHHGAPMKKAAMFRARPQVFERLLAERAGISQGEIEELSQAHARAGRYLRSVKVKAGHAARQDAPAEEAGIAEVAAIEPVASSAETDAEAVREELASPRLARGHPPATASAGPVADAEPDWRTLYSDLQKDWNDLVARAEDARAQEPDLPLLLTDGYDALISRVRVLAEHHDLTLPARSVLDRLLECHQDETVARDTAEGYLAAAERLVEMYKGLERQSEEQGVPVARLDA